MKEQFKLENEIVNLKERLKVIEFKAGSALRTIQTEAELAYEQLMIEFKDLKQELGVLEAMDELNSK